jgi:glycosyltransferase involved in cell wall biosynthesis
MPDAWDIICFANDWSSDPLSKKQVMVRLAQRHRVLWINSINNRAPRLEQKDIRRVVQKLSNFARGLVRVEERIWVLAPLYLPFHGQPFVRLLNRRLLGWQIRRALRRLGFVQPITYTFLPSSADVVGTLGEKLIVYHCVDEYGAFSDAAGAIRDRERELLAKADMVLVCSSPLLRSKQELNPRTYLITHGVDYEHFRRATEVTTPVALELQNLPRPILGFHGLIADWVDLPMLAELARLRPGWSIVLVGRPDTDLGPILKLPNVHVLGHRPYARLPEYLRGFDVALLPFVVNELTLNANPLKLREYLAAGLPVVAAPLPEASRFQGLVAFAGSADEYLREIKALLEQGMAGPSGARSERVAGETWDCKVEQIERALGDALANRAASPLAPLIGELKVTHRFQGRHSEVLEYQPRSDAHKRALIVKRVTSFRSASEAEEDLVREYRAIEAVRKRAPSLAEGGLPLPLLVAPDQRAIVFEKLPGTKLSAILKRDANLLTGAFGRWEVRRVAWLVGRWLKGFHEATRQPPGRYTSHTYLANLARQLDRGAAVELSPEAKLEVWELAREVSDRAGGETVPNAARHGDFIPQNILVDRNRIALVDFENFSEYDTIYEDLGTFIAYLTMLKISPFYSRGGLETAVRSFVEGYGESLSRDMLGLYVVKAVATVVGEFPKKDTFHGRWKAYSARRQLLSAARELLGGERWSATRRSPEEERYA